MLFLAYARALPGCDVGRRVEDAEPLDRVGT
jgi:hypothetical protein